MRRPDVLDCFKQAAGTIFEVKKPLQNFKGDFMINTNNQFISDLSKTYALYHPRADFTASKYDITVHNSNMKIVTDYIKQLQKKYATSTIRQCQHYLKMLLFHCGNDLALSQITEKDLIKILGKIESEKINFNMCRFANIFRNFFDYCIKKGEREDNPMLRISTETQIQFTVNEEKSGQDHSKLQQAANQMIAKLNGQGTMQSIKARAIITLISHTDIRISELGRITVGGFNTDSRTIRLDENKTFYLDDFTTNTIEKYIDRLREDQMITAHSMLFTNHFGQPISRQGIWQIIERNLNKTGCQGTITPKQLQGAFAGQSILTWSSL